MTFSTVHRLIDDPRDVLIVGAGPVGLFSVFACGMMGLGCHVIDALDHAGGQCSALYPHKPIYDIPGFPSVDGQDLIDRLLAQAAPFSPRYHFSRTLVGCDDRVDHDGLIARTDRGDSVRVRSVILAGGAGSFGPNRLPVAEAAQFENRSLFYSVRDPALFDGKRVVIAGGGDSALDWALMLKDRAAVTLVHRRHRFRALPESAARLEQAIATGSIILKAPFEIAGLEGENGALHAVRLRSHDDQEIESYPCDTVLAFFGLASDTAPLRALNLVMERGQIVVDPTTCAASRPRFYAVGDMAWYPRKRKLILTGFAEAAQAAQAIYQDLYPDRPYHHEHSTTKGVPKTG